MASPFRTKEQTEKYQAYKAAGGLASGCRLCEKEPIKVFTYWKVIPNDFPYDVVASTHRMLVPLRHTAETELTQEEADEFKTIKAGYVQEYDYLIEATEKQKSIPQHFHLHLIVGK